MQTIGERLEDARKRKGISIREAAEATKIRGDYLQKFESNHFDIGLTEIYVRGFLRNYSTFLRLPADRILDDFAALGHTENRPRQPSREVYGRMDVSVASADDRGERTAAPQTEPAVQSEIGRGPGHAARGRSSGAAAGPLIDPALVFKGGIALALVVGVVLILWVGKALLGGSSGKEPEHDLPAATTVQPAETESPLTFFAIKPVKIKVVRQSDSSELFQGNLQEGEHRDFPDVPIFLSASAIENVQIDYKGQRYVISNEKYKGYKVKIPIQTPFGPPAAR